MKQLNSCPYRTQRGISLLNLLISLAIISIAANVATPSFSKMIESYQSDILRNDIMNAFRQARLHALEFETPVIICGSSDHQTCDKQWNSDIIIFQDHNKDAQINGTDTILFQVDPSRGLGEINNYRRYFRFKVTGALASMPDSFRYCSQYPEYNWRVVISRSGRVRSADHEDDGSPIRCAN
jgi:type IV fimbrial biogenesis protein FimT